MAAQVRTEAARQKEERKLIAEIEKRHGKSVDQLREEREKRVRDAIQLRVPDRVPVNVATGVFAVRYAGIDRHGKVENVRAMTKTAKEYGVYS